MIIEKLNRTITLYDKNDLVDRKRSIEREFNKVLETSKPKVITFDEYANKYELYDKNNPEKHNRTMQYGKALAQYAGKIEKYDPKRMQEMLSNDKQNHVFHAGKLGYLCDQLKNVGFYSYPQSTYKKVDRQLRSYMHPGSFRQHALWLNEEWSQNIIVWDAVGDIDADVLTFEEWWSLFSELDKRMWVECYDSRIEMHVEEERHEINKCVELNHKFFTENKVVLLGEMSETLKEMKLFDTEVKEGFRGVIIQTKGDYTLELNDLRYLSLLAPTGNVIEKENFTIRINYT